MGVVEADFIERIKTQEVSVKGASEIQGRNISADNRQ
jgi:hypothetical protein